jgi:hypothetical protein
MLRYLALVMVVVCSLSATALGSDYVLSPPEDWVEQPAEVVAPQMAKLRAIRGTKSVEAQLWMSPDNATQLTAMRWRVEMTEVNQKSLEEFDAGVVQGVAKAASKHVSDERHWEGNRLLGLQVDINGDMTIKQKRSYIVDSDRTVHMFNLVCAGPGESLATCEAVMSGASWNVPNSIMVPAKASESEHDLSYRIGRYVGVAIGLLAIGWLVYKLRKS